MKTVVQRGLGFNKQAKTYRSCGAEAINIRIPLPFEVTKHGLARRPAILLENADGIAMFTHAELEKIARFWLSQQSLRRAVRVAIEETEGNEED